MAKRPLDEVEEFVEVGNVTHPSQNAKIHGVVGCIFLKHACRKTEPLKFQSDPRCSMCGSTFELHV